MSFLKRYGQPVDIKSFKRLDARTIFLKGINDQIALLEGKPIANKKKTPITSWFRDNCFAPCVGNYLLFEGKAFDYNKGEEMEMMKELKKGFDQGEFDDLLSKIEDKRIEVAKRLSVSKSNGAGTAKPKSKIK